MDYKFMASLIVFTVGLVFFIAGRLARVKTGIHNKDFISGMYLYEKVLLFGKRRKILLRRLEVADILAIGGVPNYIYSMFTTENIQEEVDKLKKDIEKKTEEENIKDSIEYYDFLQRVAERSIVAWDSIKEDWEKVDPQFTGRLPEETLLDLFNVQINNKNIYVKKKKIYYDLLSLERNTALRRALISKKVGGKETV